MYDKFSQSLKFFQGFLSQRFVQNKKEAIEIIMMLVAGNLMGFYNPDQIAGHLGINKNSTKVRFSNFLSREEFSL